MLDGVFFVVCRSVTTRLGPIVEGFVQGRSLLKRLLLSLATAVAIMLAFGSASALACEALGVDRTEAKAGEPVKYTLSACQFNDDWQLVVLFESPDSQDETREQRTLATGIAEDTTITGDFALPEEIGDKDQEVTVRLLVIRDGLLVEDSPEVQMNYVVPVPDGGGGTGPTGPTDTTSGDDTPAVIADPIPVPALVTRTQQRKKNRAKAKSKPKAKAKAKQKSKSPAKQKTKKRTTQPVAQVAPFRTAPQTVAPRTAPAGGSFQPSALPKPSAGPPPGLGGPPTSNGTPPDGGTPIVPITPPVAPAASTGQDDNALGAPFWLIALFGLLTLLGLGGAQTRLLGFWGPLPPMSRDPRDARLLALQRAAQSGAMSQKRIAELKKQANDRSRVG
jgi:hypothetical protein